MGGYWRLAQLESKVERILLWACKSGLCFALGYFPMFFIHTMFQLNFIRYFAIAAARSVGYNELI